MNVGQDRSGACPPEECPAKSYPFKSWVSMPFEINSKFIFCAKDDPK